MSVILDKYTFSCNNNPICDLGNWWAYALGNYRYRIYYSKNYKWLMRAFIREQIIWRIAVMDKDCFGKGACQICGCSTTALQMANKACPKPCYPKMMNRWTWTNYKKKNNIIIEK